MTVLIAGGGIGGLTLALSLHQIGVPCRIFESVPELKPLGVGINVLPHACRELIELGLLDQLDAAGVRTREPAYFSKHGKPIWSEPRGLEAGYKWPQFSIHRGTLQQILLDTVIARLGRGRDSDQPSSDSWTETAEWRPRHSSTRPPEPAGQLQRRRADRGRRHPFGGAREALSGRRAAAVERPHPVARHHRSRCLPRPAAP